jgi:hypothetical protein
MQRCVVRGVGLVQGGVRLGGRGRGLHISAAAFGSKLDELLPRVVDFPSRHIGPRKHEAKQMLHEIGFSVRSVPFEKHFGVFPYITLDPR